LSYNVIGAAFKVHRELGPGFVEAAYKRALAFELEERTIPFQEEVALPLVYRGKPLGAVFRADLVCEGRLLLELKALPQVGLKERRQVVHYLKATGLPLGLLLNFGEPSRHVERVLF
jgi:GxxExxY protein